MPPPLQGKHLPFSPSPLRFNSFLLFVILSLTQLYRYTPEIFLFSTATFKYTYRVIGQEYSAKVALSTFQSLWGEALLTVGYTIFGNKSYSYKMYSQPNINRQTSSESASLPQCCNTVFDMRLRVTFLRQKTVSLQSNIAHRE